jgi:hypothetical protein
LLKNIDHFDVTPLSPGAAGAGGFQIKGCVAESVAEADGSRTVARARRRRRRLGDAIGGGFRRLGARSLPCRATRRVQYGDTAFHSPADVERLHGDGIAHQQHVAVGIARRLEKYWPFIHLAS